MLGQSTQNLTLGAVALLLPLIRDDITMTFAQAGLLSVATTATYAFGQVPAGMLGDRFGARRVMLVGLFGLNILTALIALAPTYDALIAGLVLVGGLRALVFPPGLTLITADFASDRRATAMGLFMAAGFASTLLVSVAAPPLVPHVGWRGVFAVFGVGGLLTAVLYLAASRSTPSAPVRASARGLGLVWLLRQPLVWLASLVQFTRLAVTISMRFWIPTYLVLERDFSLGGAALVVAVGSIVSMAATLLGGHVSDRSGRPLTVVTTCLAGLAVGLVALTLVDELVAMIVVVALLYLLVQAYSASLFEVPLRAYGAENASVLNGLGNFWANIGGLVMSFALGVTRDLSGSFAAGWIALAGLCLLALVGAAAMRVVSR